MNKLIKISLIVAAAALTFGCASDKNMQNEQQDAYALSKKIPAPYCKSGTCVDKLGASSMETSK